mmetsp:Transcript_5306/g.9972  ORF Transcript_5306/g.9972 Transcript_5306/m.9972 type:complete len:453 (+) Transcript_5306:153-1511(+)
MRVWIVHPDLGLGGAERLVVNAGVALIQRGHDVSIFTAYHNPQRCFEETTPGGVLGKSVFVHGNWLPRTVAGKLHVVCAVLRMMWVSLIIFVKCLFGDNPDVVFCDQVSHVVPLLRWATGKRVLFYCHFPDKLLCTDRGSLVKRVYRYPIDLWEELSTGSADLVTVNSKFTGGVFRESFTRLAHVPLRVLYPAIDLTQFDAKVDQAAREAASNTFPETLKRHLEAHGSNAIVLLSINRFERKKNLKLAVTALNDLKALVPQKTFDQVHLVLAGGYDVRVAENVEHLEELQTVIDALDLNDKVSFVKSFTDHQKLLLLEVARVVIYTPDREHFGIVPVEAMYAGCPVVAVSSGGPTETVEHGKTGFLLKESEFAEKGLLPLVQNKTLAKEMGAAGRRSVTRRFGLEAFGAQLESILKECSELGPLPRSTYVPLVCTVLFAMIAALLGTSAILQ